MLTVPVLVITITFVDYIMKNAARCYLVTDIFPLLSRITLLYKL